MKRANTSLVGIILLATAMLAGFAPTATAQGLAARVDQLEAQVEALAEALEEAHEILQFVHVEVRPINNLAGPHVIFEAANVHVRSGSGLTNDGCFPDASRDPDFPNCESLTGLGNLIVGYNEQLPSRSTRASRPREVRTGSHNLVVGDFHSYSSFSGFVAGQTNRVTGPYASVSGGNANQASGDSSSVSGGFRNSASGQASSVSGGRDRDAPDESNWAAGSLLEVD